MSDTPDRITWKPARFPGAEEGFAGKIKLFRLVWDSSRLHPGKPWSLTTNLPGYEGSKWHYDKPEGLREQAEGVLAGWLDLTGIIAYVDDGGPCDVQPG